MTTNDTTDTTALKRTPLYDQHKALGARLVELSGWKSRYNIAVFWMSITLYVPAPVSLT